MESLACKVRPKNLCHLRGSPQKVGSNLGPTTDKLGPKTCTMTQHKARRTNQIAFLPLPVTQEVAGSSPDAPAKFLRPGPDAWVTERTGYMGNNCEPSGFSSGSRFGLPRLFRSSASGQPAICAQAVTSGCAQTSGYHRGCHPLNLRHRTEHD